MKKEKEIKAFEKFQCNKKAWIRIRNTCTKKGKGFSKLTSCLTADSTEFFSYLSLATTTEYRYGSALFKAPIELRKISNKHWLRHELERRCRAWDAENWQN